jgi:serine/threonine protein kinase
MKYDNILQNISNDDLQSVFGFTRPQSKRVRLLVKRMDDGESNELIDFIKGYQWTIIDLELKQQISCGSYGCIFMEAEEDMVVKISKDDDKVGMFLEALIGMILYKNKNEALKVPFVYQMGMIEYNETIRIGMSMDFVKGERIDSIPYDRQVYALNLLFEGLDIYQQSLNFSHRDLHGGNVMVDEKNVPCIIDFGNACISIPATKGSVRDTNGVAESFAEANGCLNRSHDVCMLILALCYTSGCTRFKHISKQICADYREKRKVNNFSDWDKTPWSYDKEIFHFHYVYSMYDIQLKYTPSFMFGTPSRFDLMLQKLKF